MNTPPPGIDVRTVSLNAVGVHIIRKKSISCDMDFASGIKS